MTNEDAIQLLLQMKDGIIHVFEGDRKVALEKAISALEKQDVSGTNDGDMISRAETLTMAYDCENEFGKDVAFAFADYIERLPSAQPERKKGQWYDVGSLSCRCSKCGCKSQKEYSFCPNCGADMRGEQNE